jgi:hypothetical protein
MKPQFERTREGDEAAMVANSAPHRILKKQKAPEIKIVNPGKAEIRSSAFVAAS